MSNITHNLESDTSHMYLYTVKIPAPADVRVGWNPVCVQVCAHKSTFAKFVFKIHLGSYFLTNYIPFDAEWWARQDGEWIFRFWCLLGDLRRFTKNTIFDIFKTFTFYKNKISKFLNFNNLWKIVKNCEKLCFQ
jgi:hypothetical protein